MRILFLLLTAGCIFSFASLTSCSSQKNENEVVVKEGNYAYTTPKGWKLRNKSGAAGELTSDHIYELTSKSTDTVIAVLRINSMALNNGKSIGCSAYPFDPYFEEQLSPFELSFVKKFKPKKKQLCVELGQGKIVLANEQRISLEWTRKNQEVLAFITTVVHNPELIDYQKLVDDFDALVRSFRTL
jgi:hypothetical protein